MQVKQKLFLALLSGILLAASWPFIGSVTPLLFIALLPLLAIDFLPEQPSKNKFIYPYIAFTIWNFAATYWLYNVEGGFVTKFFSFFMPSALNALFMAAVWHFAIRSSKSGSINIRLLTIFCFWLAYEYFHLDWDLSWPWLQLGNALATNTIYFQFYEYTGVLGGTAWILLANFVALKFVMYLVHHNPKKMWVGFRAFASLAIIALPLWWSVSIDYKPSANAKKINVACIQPNVDPYTEKFAKSHQVQLEELFELIEEKAPNADAYLFPETTLLEPTRVSLLGDEYVPVGLWENNIANSYSARVLRSRLVFAKNADVLAGMSADRLMPKGITPSFLDRPISGTGLYYRAYNAALFQTQNLDSIYNKSKLVPGVEKTPFASVFKHFKGIALDLGGTTGSLATQKERTVFFSEFKDYGIAPIICYESIYGDYVTRFVQNGASILSVITNDAWWGNTAGHKQHLIFSKLRAVENRRWLARAANTGISAIINPRGEILQQSKYREQTIIQGDVYTEDTLTFYTRFGDYIGRLASFVAVLLILVNITQRLRKGRELRP